MMALRNIFLTVLFCAFIGPVHAKCHKPFKPGPCAPPSRYCNSPSRDVRVYERLFRPNDFWDMEKIRRIIRSAPYMGPIECLGGVLNEIGVALGASDRIHYGRGFLISSSVDRRMRPDGKPIRVVLDRHASPERLKKARCTYVGKVYIVGQFHHTWDHVYYAALAEVIPWDVDILVIDTDLNTSRPWKPRCAPSKPPCTGRHHICLPCPLPVSPPPPCGRPVLSAEAYRRYPRRISKAQGLPGKIRASMPKKSKTRVPQPCPQNTVGITMSRRLFALAGFTPQDRVYNVVLR
jgi:hypothetical protein